MSDTSTLPKVNVKVDDPTPKPPYQTDAVDGMVWIYIIRDDEGTPRFMAANLEHYPKEFQEILEHHPNWESRVVGMTVEEAERIYEENKTLSLPSGIKIRFGAHSSLLRAAGQYPQNEILQETNK